VPAIDATPIEFGVFLPQLAMEFSQLLDAAQSCEELGLNSLWLMDHIYPPGLPDVASLEAWTAATALLARTSALHVGHLVLANAFRHPVLLGKMATTLDHISGGRLELGIGSGSVPIEFAQAGIALPAMPERSAQLGEALEILHSMFGQPRTSFDGVHYQLDDVPNVPQPATPGGPRIHVGGIGERFTLPLVARYADVWNVPTSGYAEYGRKTEVVNDLCVKIGRDPATLQRSQQVIIGVASNTDGVARLQSLVDRRYSGPGWGADNGACVGTPDAVVAALRRRVADGVTIFICLFADRGARESLELFAREVAPAFR